jgi:HD-GYP domain-containing protein (c-di-GMP phosphodiesterase class II)
LDELQKMAGTQFDGNIVEAFVRAYQAGDIDMTIAHRPTS